MPPEVAIVEGGAKGNPDSVWIAVAAPFIGVGLVAGGELLYVGGAAAGQWIVTHPLQAHVIRAVGEEVVESSVTKTPFDPFMVALDLFTVFGDDMIPRRTSHGADVDAARLERWFAVQQLASEPGRIIAGGKNNPRILWDWERVVSTYGGDRYDWVKMTSSSYTCRDGTKFQIHWIQNVTTGMRVEFKPGQIRQR
ncbi:MAG: hypothetical protein ACFFA6_17470 [Promethearchaeota archaeon]